jgi:hypothetical protein
MIDDGWMSHSQYGDNQVVRLIEDQTAKRFDTTQIEKWSE